MTTCGRLVGNELSLVKLRVVCFVAVNTIFDVAIEVAHLAVKLWLVKVRDVHVKHM